VADIRTLFKVAGSSYYQQASDTDTILIGGVGNGTSGTATLYGEDNTTSITIGGGTSQTSVQIGGGAAYTGTTIGVSGTQDVMAGSLEVTETLTLVNGTVVRDTAGTASLFEDALTTTIAIGGGATYAGTTIGKTGVEDTMAGDLRVAGNLVVDGTTTTINTEVVNVADNYMYLNDGYTTNSAEPGGLVVNYLPTSVATTVGTGGFTAGTGGSADPTVKVASTTGFSAGMFVQVSGAANQDNDGVYEVSSVVDATTLAIAGTAATAQNTRTAPNDFTQTDFTTDATVQGAVTQVTVSALRAGTDGVWETAASATVGGLSFADLATAAGSSLQTAYEAGNTITTALADGNVTINGTEALAINVDKSSNFSVENVTASTNAQLLLEVDNTGATSGDATVQIQATSTNGSGLINVVAEDTLNVQSSFANVDINAATASTFTVTGAGQDLTLLSSGGSVTLEGTEAVANAVHIHASAAAGGIDMDAGTGGVAVDSNGAISLDANSTVSNFTLTQSAATTATTLTVLADNTGSGASDSTLILRATSSNGTAQVDMDADNINIDGVSTVSLDSASGNFTTSSGNLTLQSTGAGIILNAATLLDVDAGANMDVDVTGTFDLLASSTFSIDGTGASNVTATSGDLTLSTATTGSVLIDGQDGVEINSAAGTLNIGNDDVDQAINIGTGQGDRAISIGNTFAGNTADVTFAAREGSITLNEADFVVGADTIEGQTLSGFTASSIVGALNELKASGGGTVENQYTAQAILVLGDIVYQTTTTSEVNKADASSANAAGLNYIGVAETGAAAAAPVTVVSWGVAEVVIDATTTYNPGDELFLSETAGQATKTAPTTSGAVVQSIGFVKVGGAKTAGQTVTVNLSRGHRTINL
jgi:redox-sensitive bicupin YhaK (pirin superfamily)